jgi:hypothetical protein
VEYSKAIVCCNSSELYGTSALYGHFSVTYMSAIEQLRESVKKWLIVQFS